MEKPFVYGMAVSGENFTDREKVTKRLSMNFQSGVNTILISPRRLGKTSLVNKVADLTDSKDLRVVRMYMYDCRNEYDFYDRFASVIIKELSGGLDKIATFAKEFLYSIVPKISLSTDPNTDFSISLGLTPKTTSPEEILDLPERIAKKKGIHIVICIDEFQQVGEFPNSLSVQKKLRSVWQMQKNVSYCLYGSKKHLMEHLFQNKRMPFYQFGDMVILDKIDTESWVRYIKSRFALKHKEISDQLAAKICETVSNYSSYVQQLAWNVMVESGDVVTQNDFDNGLAELLNQTSALFTEKLASLTTYQFNFLKAVADGVHNGFENQAIMEQYNFGTKSNVVRLKNSLINKDILEHTSDGVCFTDPVLEIWFKNL